MTAVEGLYEHRFDELVDLSAALMQALGVPKGPATRTGFLLCVTEAWGIRSHGLLRLPFYLQRLKEGGVSPSAHLKLVSDKGAATAFDGENGLGHWQAWDAACRASVRAKRYGSATVAVGNSSHCGALGLYVHPIVAAGQVAMIFSNGPAAMPPWGGGSAVVSTSPLAAGFPRPGGPIVVDLSLGSITRGRIAELAQHNEPLPEGAAYDQSGAPTTDASAALGGMVAPIGKAKGAALALALEGLTGALVGPHLAVDVADPLAPEQAARHQGLSHLVMAFDPDALTVDGSSASRFELLFGAVLASGGRLPGTGHAPPDSFTGEETLTLAESTVRSLNTWAEQLGVKAPERWRWA